jgi:hypothetical protein
MSLRRLGQCLIVAVLAIGLMAQYHATIYAGGTGNGGFQPAGVDADEAQKFLSEFDYEKS